MGVRGKRVERQRGSEVNRRVDQFLAVGSWKADRWSGDDEGNTMVGHISWRSHVNERVALAHICHCMKIDRSYGAD